jgi:hypothetical protein
MIEARLEEATIKILLDCRKAIDYSRIAKQKDRVELKTTTESKIGTLSPTVTAEQAASKEDYQIMQDSFTISRDACLSVLLENGFESMEAFYKFNETMCLEEIRRIFPIVTYCDRCKGYEGKPPCECEDYIQNWEYNEKYIDLLYSGIVLPIWRSAIVYEDGSYLLNVAGKFFDSGKNLYRDKISICPDGHGFSYNYMGLPSFDLSWK